MKTVPLQIGGARVVAYTAIDHRHRFTGQTKHTIAGKQPAPAAAIATCQYENDTSFYLFGCDENWNAVTDTCHDTIAEARDQAEFEYSGTLQTWVCPETDPSLNQNL